MRVPVILTQAMGTRKAGERLDLPRNQARVLKALGKAEDPPVEAMTTHQTEALAPSPQPEPRPRAARVKSVAKRTYKTRRLKAKG